MKDDLLKINIREWRKNCNITVCLIGIIDEEMSEIVKEYNMKIQNDNYIYWEGCSPKFPNVRIVCYQQEESGNVDSSQLMSYLLDMEYDYYIYVGTSGAIKGSLYDVVVANQVVYLTKGTNTVLGREFDGKAPEIPASDINMINAFLTKIKISENLSFSVKSAPIYSGEDVEKDKEREELIAAQNFARHLAVIDMESYGALKAIRFYQSFKNENEKHIFIIRGISDYADGDKNSEYEDGIEADERKRIATRNAIHIANGFISCIVEMNNK